LQQGTLTCPICRGDLSNYNVDTELRNITIAGLAETALQQQAVSERPKNHLWSADLTILPNNQIGELTLAIRDSKFTVQPSLFIAVIDNSGSMSGSAFKQVKTALLHIISMAQYNPSVIIKFIIYNSFANVLALVGQPEQDRNIVNALHAGGGTNFSEAFRSIREVLYTYRTHDIDSAAIAFLTDGQDGSGLTRDVLVTNLRDILLDSWTRPISVHALGFSAGCDRVFLENLLGCGTLQGTFRYAEPGDNDDALCQKLTGVFEICSKQSSVPVSFTGLQTIFSDSSFRFPVDSKGWGRYQCWIKITDIPTSICITSAYDAEVELPLNINTNTQNVNCTYEKWLSTLSDTVASKILELQQYQKEPEEIKLARASLLQKYLKEIGLHTSVATTKERITYMREQLTGWLSGQQLSLGRLSDMRFSTLFGGKSGAKQAQIAGETGETRETKEEQKAIADKPTFERCLKCYNRNNSGKERNSLQEAICAQIYGEIITAQVQELLDIVTLEDLTHLDADGNNTIMLAAYCGHTAILQSMVKHCAADLLNTYNTDGESAVTLCIKKRGFHKSLMVLVGAGANVPSQRKKALERYCIDNKYVRTAALLQQIGDTVTYDIDETMSNDYVRYVYGQAKAVGKVNAEQYIVVFLAKALLIETQEMLNLNARVNVDMLNKYCIPPKPDHPETAHYIELAKALLHANSAMINETDTEMETPLHAATRKGSLPHVKYFLSLGAHIDTPNDKGNNALAVAVNMRFPCIVDELLLRGANVHYRNIKGNTPLYGACERGPLKVAEKLISHGAEIETLNNNGDTTILICCRNGQNEVLHYLLQYVDMEFVNKKAHIDGFNAIMACAEADRASCITVLKDYGVDLSQKTDPDNKIISGATPLHIAAYYGRNSALTELLRLGVDPNTRDLNGSTALHIATLQGYGEAIKLLLQAGADSTITDACNNTSLSYCRDRAEIKEFFIDSVTEILIRMAKGAYSNLPFLIAVFRDVVDWHWPHKMDFQNVLCNRNIEFSYGGTSLNSRCRCQYY
jgi:ankyrin repeat protein